MQPTGITLQQWNETFNVFKIKTDINILRKSCLECYSLLNHNDVYPVDSALSALTTTETLKRAKSYNLFAFPLPGFYDIFCEIVSALKSLPTFFNKKLYAHAWLNVAHQDEFIDWHFHSSTAKAGWVGVIYVHNTKQSNTHFIYKPENEIIHSTHIAPGDGHVLMYREVEGMLHRTYPSLNKDPRITIAFSVVPQDKITDNYKLKDYWVPMC